MKEYGYTNFIGLWEHNDGNYVSATINKKDIPSFSRIVVKKNKYYKKGTRRPFYQVCFVVGNREYCTEIQFEKGKGQDEE